MFDLLPAPDFSRHTLPATVVRWVDGDTVILKVSGPFRFTYEGDFRLAGIDCPERGKMGWREAALLAEHLAPVGSVQTVRTYKDPDKYGRYLAVLGNEALTVNDVLVLKGMAGLYTGGTRVPFVASREAVVRVLELVA